MSNIVGFPAKHEPQIWVCTCGCSTFRLHSTGTTECASCGHFGSDNAEWFTELPEPAAEPKQRLTETKVISLNGSPSSALRKMLSSIDPDLTVAVMAVAENGRVNTWGGVDTAERAEWLERRFDEARGLLTSFVPKENT